MNKIVGLIASHLRYEILKDCVSCLKPQVDDIVLCGSSEWVDGVEGCNLAKKVSKEEDLIYVDHTNKILGRKWQAALDRARQLDPDAVLICGSDDLIEEGYLDEYCGERMFGVNWWIVYNSLLQDMVHCSYTIRKDPLGSGRVIPSRCLETYNWDVFPYKTGEGCDGYSYERVNGGKEWDNYGRTVFSIKGDWDVIDSWDQLCSSQYINVQWLNGEDMCFYLNKFPHIDFEKYRSKI